MGALPVVQAHRAVMRQLLQNLIDNALKFHAPDRPPVVCVSGEPVAGTGAGGAWCRLVVADNGAGIAPEDCERIFGLFQRAHGAGYGEGSGIGLALCRRIVERYGGRLTVSSTPGEGTRFEATLPGG